MEKNNIFRVLIVVFEVVGVGRRVSFEFLRRKGIIERVGFLFSLEVGIFVCYYRFVFIFFYGFIGCVLFVCVW